MEQNLRGKNVAILVTDGFEQEEMTRPKQALEQAGARTVIVSASEGSKVRGWKDTDWGDEFFVDCPVTDVSAEDYDALLLPGGVMNPDKLRLSEPAVTLTRDFFAQGKPVAAIRHGPWTLIEAGVVRGRTMTSYPSLQTDLRNAGAQWVDEEVVADSGLITSRKPDDIPAFNAAFIEEIASGVNRNFATPSASEGRMPVWSDLDEDEEDLPVSPESRHSPTNSVPA